MKPNPENPKGWTLPAEIPPAFALPQQFRELLPAEVQQWLDSVEKRIDGMTLESIEDEADRLIGHLDNPGEIPDGDWDEAAKLYRLGRRIFYNRMQQIVGIMFPEEVVEIGVDLLWTQTTNTLPGGAVTDAVINGEGLNTNCLRRLKDVGFALGGTSLM